MAMLQEHVNFRNAVTLGERDGVKVVRGLKRLSHAPIVVKTYRTRTSATGKQLEYKYLHKAEVEARLLLYLHERVGDRADINIYCDEYQVRSGLSYSSVSITMPACPTQDLLSIYDRMCGAGDMVLPNETTCAIGLELIKEVQHLHKKGLCHGDLHAGNVLVSKLAMVHRDPRPPCFRTLFEVDDPPLEVRIIDFNMSFPFEKADSSPFNENGRTGKPGAMLLHDDIKAADRYTVLDDVGSIAIVLLFCSLGYNAFSSLSMEAKRQLQRARQDNDRIKHAGAASQICQRMDKFVRTLLAEGVSSCDGDDEVIKELVPRVPAFLRHFMRVVVGCRQKIVTSRKITQTQIAAMVDYEEFSAVFEAELVARRRFTASIACGAAAS
jgi:serine/threonine protein kinase